MKLLLFFIMLHQPELPGGELPSPPEGSRLVVASLLTITIPAEQYQPPEAFATSMAVAWSNMLEANLAPICSCREIGHHAGGAVAVLSCLPRFATAL